MGGPHPQTTSPTKTGERRPDRFWLLKYENVRDVDTLPHITHNGIRFAVQPVFSKEADFEGWMRAPRVTKGLMAIDVRPWEIIVGRRINDEVELFEGEDGKEVPGLREDLQRLGLTVRSYVPEPEVDAKPKFKRPSFTATLGLPQLPQDNMTSYRLKMQTAIATLEVDEKTGIEYGVIADSGNKTKHLLVCKLRREDFKEWYIDAEEEEDDDEGGRGKTQTQTIKTQGVKYRVLGGIDNGQVKFNCSEEVLKTFFKNGGTHLDAHFFDHAKYKEEEERAALKAQRKMEKKHRRQVTASSHTPTLSDHSSTTVLAEEREQEGDEVVVKARQREKSKVKKKAQQARKKAARSASESITTVSTAGNEDEDEEENTEIIVDDWKSDQMAGSFLIFRALGGGLGGTRLVSQNGIGAFMKEIDDAKRERGRREEAEGTGTETERLSQGDVSSSSSEGDGGDLGLEGEGMDVVLAKDTEDIHKVIENAKGPVIVINPVALGIEDA